MLDASHEVNSALQSLEIVIRGVFALAEEAANASKQRAVKAKQQGLTLSQCNSSSNATSSSSSDAASWEILRKLQGVAVSAVNTFSTLSAALECEFGKQRPFNAAGGARSRGGNARSEPDVKKSNNINNNNNQSTTVANAKSIVDCSMEVPCGSGDAATTATTALLSQPAISTSVATSVPPPTNTATALPSITSPRPTRPPASSRPAASPRPFGASTTGGGVGSVARDTAAFERGGGEKTGTAFIGEGLYLALDAVGRSVGASTAMVLQQVTKEDAQCLAIFVSDVNVIRRPHTISAPLRDSVPGSVLRSGLALHVEITTEANKTPPLSQPHLACFPFYTTPHTRSVPAGVVWFEKPASAPTFHPDELSLIYRFATMVSQFVYGYGVTLSAADAFDPHAVLLRHNSVVLEHLSNQTASSAVKELRELAELKTLISTAGPSSSSSSAASPAALASVEQLQLAVNAFASQSVASKLASTISNNRPSQLVLRSVHRVHGASATKAAASSSSAAAAAATSYASLTANRVSISTFKTWTKDTIPHKDIVDVADYVEQLQQSWQQLSSDIHDLEMEQIEQMQDNNVRKKKLKSTMQRLDETEQTCREFKNRYASLKNELKTLVNS